MKSAKGQMVCSDPISNFGSRHASGDSRICGNVQDRLRQQSFVAALALLAKMLVRPAQDRLDVPLRGRSDDNFEH
jgi:hypothetical protein